jgi:hypothetical protein
MVLDYDYLISRLPKRGISNGTATHPCAISASVDPVKLLAAELAKPRLLPRSAAGSAIAQVLTPRTRNGMIGDTRNVESSLPGRLAGKAKAFHPEFNDYF